MTLVVLVMAGMDEHIARFNALYDAVPPLDVPLVIIGGGRVGQATGAALASRGVDYRIIEKLGEKHYLAQQLGT